MSPIIINASTSNVTSNLSTAKVANLNTKKVNQSDNESTLLESIQETPKDEDDTEVAREERKATGRSVAILIFLCLMCLALYHVVQRKTTILAGVLVPALILFTYLFFMINISSRDKKRRKELENEADIELSLQTDPKKLELQKKISTVSSPSIVSASSASIQSTSGVSLTSARNAKVPMLKSPSLTKIDPKTAKLIIEMRNSKVLIDPKANTSQSKKVPPPFKKAQSQSHMQVKSNQSNANVSIENEKKKLKKSRSFDKNIAERHMTDSKSAKSKR